MWQCTQPGLTQQNPKTGNACAEGPYEVFAGCECAKALAKMSKDKVDCTADLSGLSDREFEILCDWEVRFKKKYPVVGQASVCLVAPCHAKTCVPSAVVSA